MFSVVRAPCVVACGTAMIALVMLSACQREDERIAPQPIARAGFPLALTPDVLVSASADGSDLREEPYTHQFRHNATESPDGLSLARVDDRQLVIESRGAPITPAGLPALGPSSIVWAPNSQRLLLQAFSRDGVPGDYFVVAADGSTVVRMPPGLYAGWAPESDTLAFATAGARPDENVLNVVGSDGTGQRAIGTYPVSQSKGYWPLPEWSPDGEWIATRSARTQGGITLLSTTGAASIDLGEGDAGRFSWSPDSDAIVYEARRGASNDDRAIWVVRLDEGAHPHDIASGVEPQWSPGGDRIVFRRREPSSPTGFSSRVFTIRADGSTETAIGPGGNFEYQDVKWSSDGSRISFVRPAFSASRLVAIDIGNASSSVISGELGAQGNPLRQLFVAPDRSMLFYFLTDGWWRVALPDGQPERLDRVSVFEITWTQQGPRLFVSSDPPTGGVRIVEPDGHERTILAGDTSYNVSTPPTNKRIALQSWSRLLTYDLGKDESKVIVDLGTGGDMIQGAQISPDATHLWYETTSAPSATTGPMWKGFVVDLGSGKSRELPESVGMKAAWSPDGKSIAYTHSEIDNGDLWLAAADGGHARSVYHSATICCEALHWSPDGSRVAFVEERRRVLLLDVTSGDVATIATGGELCRLGIADWSPDARELFVYPACDAGPPNIYGN